MTSVECLQCGRAADFAATPHPAHCLCGGAFVAAGQSTAGRLRRERDEARRALAVSERRRKAIVGWVQLAARSAAPLMTHSERDGLASVLAAELPEAWSA